MEKKFLHFCGGSATKDNTLEFFLKNNWDELIVELTRNKDTESSFNFSPIEVIPDKSLDAIFSYNNITNFCIEEVHYLLKNFHRILKEDGFLVVSCPDLQRINSVIESSGLHGVLFVSNSGPVTPHILLYGIDKDPINFKRLNPIRCGFDINTLEDFISRANFSNLMIYHSSTYFLWAVARKAYPHPDNFHSFSLNVLNGV